MDMQKYPKEYIIIETQTVCSVDWILIRKFTLSTEKYDNKFLQELITKYQI